MMDLATWGGLGFGIGIMIISMFMSAKDVQIYMNLPSVFITFGGMICATTISFSMEKLKDLYRVLKHAFFEETRSPVELIDNMGRYAEIARRDGILALEGQTSDIGDEFLVKGIQLAVDGTDPELINQTMTTELQCLVNRHAEGRKIMIVAGTYAPAFGLVGTLVGLIGMLAQLDDPSQIGLGMAVALITTLYGAVASNLILLPLADKLKGRSEQEALLKEIVIRGVMSIQSGDNPRIVAQKLRIYLPPKYRAANER